MYQEGARAEESLVMVAGEEDDPLFQRPGPLAVPEAIQDTSIGRVRAGAVTRLLVSSILGVAAFAGCGESSAPNCPTPTPQVSRQPTPQPKQVTCTAPNGTHYVYIPGRGWSSTGHGSGFGRSGHSSGS